MESLYSSPTCHDILLIQHADRTSSSHLLCRHVLTHKVVSVPTCYMSCTHIRKGKVKGTKFFLIASSKHVTSKFRHQEKYALTVDTSILQRKVSLLTDTLKIQICEKSSESRPNVQVDLLLLNQLPAIYNCSCSLTSHCARLLAIHDLVT